MKIKTQDMTPIALNWAVAKAHGENPVIENGVVYSLKTIAHREYKLVWEPSINWGQGGPVIERERIEIFYIRVDNDNEPEWGAGKYGTLVEQSGPTPLIAAMRCYVASKMGNEVDVPDEIKE